LASTVDEQYWLAEFSQFASDNPLPMEWAGSDVDSGGGWFADIDGTMQLVGINGFGRGNNTITGAIRVSLYNDWIDEMMVAHSTPEPSSIALAAMAALGVFGLGRRRN
jgi:MYXO-CTERM domain-containing protein